MKNGVVRSHVVGHEIMDETGVQRTQFVHRLGRLMTARSKLHFHLLVDLLGFRQRASCRALAAVASSAGKKHSILICCSAASIGIASVVKVEMNESRKSPLASCIVMTGEDAEA